MPAHWPGAALALLCCGQVGVPVPLPHTTGRAGKGRRVLRPRPRPKKRILFGPGRAGGRLALWLVGPCRLSSACRPCAPENTPTPKKTTKVCFKYLCSGRKKTPGPMRGSFFLLPKANTCSPRFHSGPAAVHGRARVESRKVKDLLPRLRYNSPVAELSQTPICSPENIAVRTLLLRLEEKARRGEPITVEEIRDLELLLCPSDVPRSQ